MHRPPCGPRAAGLELTVLVVVAAAITACSAPASTPAPAPSVNFDANGGTSVGMPGMRGMPSPPASAPSTVTAATPIPTTGNTVSISNFAFAPEVLTVTRGSTVTWTNHDEEPHTIAAGDGSFRSPGMDLNGTYSHTFATAGTFDYVCSIHPFMHATVTVTP